MKEIRTEVNINAPIDDVWKVLTDFNGWQSWNPTVVKVEGNGKVGEKLVVTMQNGDKEMQYFPTVVEADQPRKFRWRAKMLAGFIFTNDRIFELEQVGDNTKLTHIEAFSGLMVNFSWAKMQEFVPKILGRMK